MDSQVGIELWADKDGHSPLAEFFLSLETEHQDLITKKNDFIQKLKWHELKFHKQFKPIQGVSLPLYELCYSGSGGHNFRMLCFRWKDKLVGVEMFKGSGSGGRVKKYTKTAIKRAEDWKKRNP